MTDRPDRMPNRPERGTDFDLISDVLRAVRLQAAYFYKVIAHEPWCVTSNDALVAQAGIFPQCEHRIAYHVLVEGRCWGGLPGAPLQEMRPGDIIVFPSADPQLMASAPDRCLRPQRAEVRLSDALPFEVNFGGRGARNSTFVCGFLGCDRRPFNPLLEDLPDVLLIHGGAGSWLDIFARQAIEEAQAQRPGGEAIVARLAELMFIETLRRHLATLPPEQRGWLSAARDGIAGRALTLLHARPAYAWTLAGLADKLHCSRSVLAERFAQFIGSPPMQYLTRWRMQLAAQRLADSTAKLPEIAREVGYESEAAFSRAFKRVAGAPPAVWRAARTGALTDKSGHSGSTRSPSRSSPSRRRHSSRPRRG